MIYNTCNLILFICLNRCNEVFAMSTESYKERLKQEEIGLYPSPPPTDELIIDLTVASRSLAPPEYQLVLV